MNFTFLIFNVTPVSRYFSGDSLPLCEANFGMINRKQYIRATELLLFAIGGFKAML